MLSFEYTTSHTTVCWVRKRGPTYLSKKFESRIPEVLNILSQVAPLISIKKKRARAEAMLKQHEQGNFVSHPSLRWSMPEIFPRTLAVLKKLKRASVAEVSSESKKPKETERYRLNRLCERGYAVKEKIGNEIVFSILDVPAQRTMNA